MTVDPHETTIATCDRGHTFEDLAVAVAENGGWCPTCDGPARRSDTFDQSASRIPRAALPDREIGLHPGYTPEENQAYRWALLVYEIQEEFRTLRRQVRTRVRAERVRIDESIEESIQLAAVVAVRATPVNARDDGRWGEATPSTSGRGV